MKHTLIQRKEKCPLTPHPAGEMNHRDRTKFFLLLFFVHFALYSPTVAFFWQSGVTGFQFLKLGVGARPVAMGSAYTAVADDANSLFWNPAGLGMSPSFDASLMMMNLFQNVTYSSLGLVTPLGKFFGLGIGGSYLYTQDTRRNQFGQDEGTFGISDFALGPGLAFKPLKNLSWGGSLKFLGSRLDTFNTYALSIDFGLIYSPFRYFYLGSSFLHLGPPRRFINQWEYPPVNLRGGAAFKYPFLKNHIIIASDISLYPDVEPRLSLGGEFRLDVTEIVRSKKGGQAIAIRGGYQSGYHLGIWSGFSFGIGYEYEIGPMFWLVIDAVYFSYGFLGESQRVSLSLRYLPK